MGKPVAAVSEAVALNSKSSLREASARPRPVRRKAVSLLTSVCKFFKIYPFLRILACISRNKIRNQAAAGSAPRARCKLTINSQFRPGNFRSSSARGSIPHFQIIHPVLALLASPPAIRPIRPTNLS